LTGLSSALGRPLKNIRDVAGRNGEPYIDLAATAKADFLITRDKDLLSLMAGHSLLHKQFRQQTHPLEVLDPVAFLKALEHLGKPPH
jgi:predicted nucleic acid-binding protein